MKDFTLEAYHKLLLALRLSGYSFFTFEEWCDGKAKGRYVILRHDVDLKAENSLVTARIEAEMGIRSTYYFRVVSQSNQPEVIKAIAALGHEIGYHYEDLSLFDGDVVKAMDHFKYYLEYFRRFYPVRTISMHGKPTSKWDNRDLWETYNYKDFGVIGEPYLDFMSIKTMEVTYFTDTARMWDGSKYNLRDKLTENTDRKANKEKPSSQTITYPLSGNHITASLNYHITHSPLPHIHSTNDFINWLNTKPSQNCMMITTHPQRWTNKPGEWIVELVMQSIKNRIKQWFFR